MIRKKNRQTEFFGIFLRKFRISFLFSINSMIRIRFSGSQELIWKAFSRAHYDENQSHPRGRWHYSSPEALPRLGDERERTSTGSDQRDHRCEWSIGVACTDHEIRAKYSATSTKFHERNPQRADLPFGAHSL